MRVYERSGVTVDQCSECRGIFLDRGELEKLVDAETAFNAGQQPAAALQPQSQPAGPAYEERPRREYDDRRRYDDRRGYDDDRRRYDDGRRDDRYYGKKKRKSFFEELFD